MPCGTHDGKILLWLFPWFQSERQYKIEDAVKTLLY